MNLKMTIKRASLLVNVITILSIICAGALLFYLRIKIDVNEKATNERFFSMLLVDELRKSSEELTRQVRNYAVTGNEEAANAYNKVLAVRNGIEPRPAHSLIYPGENKVLLELLKEFGITDEEFALVQQANALSDDLVALEVESMNAVNGLFMDEQGQYSIRGEPDREHAVQLVFSSAYDGEVEKIMRPMSEFEEKVLGRTEEALKTSLSNKRTAQFFCYLSLATVLALAVFNLMFVSVVIVTPITHLTKLIRKLSLGHINLVIKKDRKNNEIGQMRVELDKLLDGLKNAVDFAHNIGNGNLDVEYKMLSDNDMLGAAVLEMRESLLKAHIEQQKRATEEEQRNWGTTGLAKFAEILRHDNNNMEALAYNVISNMVKYMDANQGGIFILNEADNEEERLLELKACYAFDRKKFAEKQIHVGEGLVGACFLEGAPIYMTEVPDTYVSITSGLGKANPTAIFICPLKLNDEVFGVIELASFTEFAEYQREFVEKLSESIAATISTVRVNMRTNKLLDRTKLQAEEMANQEEELRQNMEEMHATQEEMRRREVELQQTVSQMSEMQDVSEEKEYEMQQFRDAIFDTFSIYEFSPDGYITAINDSFLKMFNVDRSAFIGKHDSEFISQEEYNMAWGAVARKEIWDSVQEVEVEGKIKAFHHRYIPISDRKGELLRVLVFSFLENN